MSGSPYNRSGVKKTPRPAPLPVMFQNVQPTFSTKRAKRTYSRVPHQPSRPSHFKTAPPPQNRFGPRTKGRWTDQRAHLISFKAHSESYLDHLPSSQSRSYDDSRTLSYFNQCFEKLCKIGEGSFGEVFKVRSKENGELYAVKRAVERFRGSVDRTEKLKEVQKHEELPKHRNLVQFIGAWEEKGRLYIQIELCSSSLEDLCERVHNIPEDLVWKYLVDLLLAVQHLHNHDLVHMDIKPDNIFISQDGFCKLGDFGLVIDLKRTTQGDFQEGDAKYLAPELLREQAGKEADIFCLGISILEISCDLELPTSGEEWQMLRKGQLPFELMTHLSEDLVDIIKKMLDPDPHRRPSAKDLLRHPTLRPYLYQRQLYAFYIQSARLLKSCASSVWFFLYLLLTILFSPVTRALEWYQESKGKRKFSSNVRPPCFLAGNLGRTPEVEDRLAMPLKFEDSSSDEDYEVDLHDLSSIRSRDSPMNTSMGVLNSSLSSSPPPTGMTVEDSNTSSSSGSDERHKNRNIAGFSPVIPWNSTPAPKNTTGKRRRLEQHKDRIKQMREEHLNLSASPLSGRGDFFPESPVMISKSVSRVKMPFRGEGDGFAGIRASPRNLKHVFDHHGSSSEDEGA